MSSWSPKALAFLTLLSCGLTGSPASAQDRAPRAKAKPSKTTKKPLQVQTGKRWSKKLSHRMSRYAVLARGIDRAGDAHEQRLHQADLVRRKDGIGDKEEAVRYEAGRRGRAIQLALYRRTLDKAGDLRETNLAKMTLRRRHAMTARVGIIPRDEYIELSKYKLGRLRFGAVKSRQIRLAHQRQNQAAIERQKEARSRRQEASGRDREDREFRSDLSGLGHRERRQRSEEDIADADAVRAEERILAREEGREDAQAEKAEERRDEKADERETEREEERAEEREEERNLQQEDGAGLDE